MDLGQLTVSYITDIEGNIDYFYRFVSISEALSWEDVPAAEVLPQRLKLADGFAFIFGGDLFDKGPGDIRLSVLLTDLKDRYNERVFLIMGNRDINKLRLSAELQPPADDDEPVGYRFWDQPPFWDPKAPSLLSWLRKRGLREKDTTTTQHLQWLLECTLGSAGAFEFRREELALLTPRSGDSDRTGSTRIRDEDVCQSFLDSLEHETGTANPCEKGFLVRYLRRACLGVRIRDTLFVHGAVTARNLLWVPQWDKLRYEDMQKASVAEPAGAPIDARAYGGGERQQQQQQQQQQQLPSPPPLLERDTCAGASDRRSPFGRYLDPQKRGVMDEWLGALNEFAQLCLSDHRSRPFWDDDDEEEGSGDNKQRKNEAEGAAHECIGRQRRRGGEGITAYQSSRATGDRSIVVATFAKFSEDPTALVPPVDEAVRRFLLRGGIKRVVVGHKPVGTVPLIVKLKVKEEHGRVPLDVKMRREATTTAVAAAKDGDAVLELINADTSYSDPSAPDNRGVAVHEVLISNYEDEAGECNDMSRARIHGVLPDGKRVDYTTGDRLIGQSTAEGWWVTARRAVGEDPWAARHGSFLLTRTTGRRVENRWVRGDQVLKELAEPKMPKSAE